MSNPFLKSLTIQLASIATGCALLSACSPMYDTTDQFIPPPPSPMTAIAISQCQQTKQSCEMLVSMNKHNCESDARYQAERDYKDYKHKHPNDKDKTVNSFDNSYSCLDTTNTCDDDYKQCYISAGGKILEKRECVAFCDS